jgi:plastocyanin
MPDMRGTTQPVHESGVGQFEIHTVISYAGLFDSGPLSLGQTFSYKFTQSGTFNCYCTTHLDMTGIIIVQ